MNDTIIFNSTISTTQSGSAASVAVNRKKNVNSIVKIKVANNTPKILEYNEDYCYIYFNKKKSGLKVIAKKNFKGLYW